MKALDDYPYVMTAAQLAEFLGCSKWSAYEVMRELPAIKFNPGQKSTVRVCRDDVMKWLESRKQVRKVAN